MFRELFITDTSGYASEPFRLRLIRRKAGQVELFLRRRLTDLALIDSL